MWRYNGDVKLAHNQFFLKSKTPAKTLSEILGEESQSIKNLDIINTPSLDLDMFINCIQIKLPCFRDAFHD